jgi:cyanophycin synthetase
VLELPFDESDEVYEGWRLRIGRAGASLGWTHRKAVVRRHAGGASLAITAPSDQLFVATEVNEWALCAALAERHPERTHDLQTALIAQTLSAGEPSQAIEPTPVVTDPPMIEEAAAFARFARLASTESRPGLRALLDAAAARGLSHVLDDAELTLGSGAGGADFQLESLPRVDAVAWQNLYDVPTALVTGSNGKTTTVRLLAACARAHGRHTAYNCTDGVFIDDEALAAGDYSGPAGARWVLRNRHAQSAVLETARGGILRRGIAVSQADVAIVTNVSSDHFGEYGIHDLTALAAVKLAVAGVVRLDGLLILNADDLLLRRQAQSLAQRFGAAPRLGWFSARPESPELHALRLAGNPTCGVRHGRLYLCYGDSSVPEQGGAEYDLGPVAAMPLAMAGTATYNIANLAGAALAAAALGIPAATIATVLASFGEDRRDNPGRLMRFERAGVTALVDYAHNTDGLYGFLSVASQLRTGTGRLGLLLGQAGNRTDADIEALAQVAADFRPDLVVIKENETQLRGRAPGEVPRILHAALRRLGFAEPQLPIADSEIEAARQALAWARPGDVLALPVHSAQARAAVIAMLEDA